MKAVLTDIDGTLVEGFISVEIIRHLCRKGILSQSTSERLEAIMAALAKNEMGYLNWLQDWCKTWAEGIKGLKQSLIEQEAELFFESEFKAKVFSSSKPLIERLKGKGYHVLGLTVSPVEAIKPLRNYLGLNEAFGTIVETNNGIYTGKILTDLQTRHGKKDLIQKLAREKDLDLKNSIGLGDTHHDLQIFESVGKPVALNPNKKLQEIAREKNFLQATHENILEKIALVL